MTIHLGAPSPVTSCGSPGTIQRAISSLLSLAPSGVYRAAPVARGAGGLLHHRFTLTCALFSEAIGGLFSVALSVGSPRLGVTQHPALWSPDFPQASRVNPPPAATRRTRSLHMICSPLPQRCGVGERETGVGLGGTPWTLGQRRPVHHPARPPKTVPRAAAERTCRDVTLAPPMAASMTRAATISSPVSDPWKRWLTATDRPDTHPPTRTPTTKPATAPATATVSASEAGKQFPSESAQPPFDQGYECHRQQSHRGPHHQCPQPDSWNYHPFRLSVGRWPSTCKLRKVKSCIVHRIGRRTVL